MNCRGVILPIILFLGLFVAAIAFILLSARNPASTQASELVTLYFDIDYVRKQSAEIFAEILEVKAQPERVETIKEIGKPIPLKTREELLGSLETNNISVKSSLDAIATKSFTNQGVIDRHVLTRDFYTFLNTFEKNMLAGLNKVETEEEFARYIDQIFEYGNDWPTLLTKDTDLRNSLTQLALEYEIAFEAKAYSEIFRERLIELRNPQIKEPEAVNGQLQLGQATYEFEIPPNIIEETVNASWMGITINKMAFGLRHPDGRLFNFMIGEPPSESTINQIIINNIPPGETGPVIPSVNYPLVDGSKSTNNNSYIGYEDSWLVIKLFPEDPILKPIEGKWKLYVAAPEGIELVFGSISIPQN